MPLGGVLGPVVWLEFSLLQGSEMGIESPEEDAERGPGAPWAGLGSATCSLPLASSSQELSWMHFSFPSCPGASRGTSELSSPLAAPKMLTSLGSVTACLFLSLVSYLL